MLDGWTYGLPPASTSAICDHDVAVTTAACLGRLSRQTVQS
jgi:hypothetical protein